MTDATQPEQRSGCAGWLLSLLALALIRSAVKELGWPEWWTLVGWAALVLIVAVVIAAHRQASEQRPQQPKEPPGRPAPLSMGGEPEEERRIVLGTLAADLDALRAAREKKEKEKEEPSDR